jgi:hypothetical protein
MQTEPLVIHEEGGDPFVSGPETSCCIASLIVVR